MATFDNRKFVAAGTKYGIEMPIIDSNLIGEYVAQWRSSDIIPRPRSLSNAGARPLEGKVALITGATSGIGKAIAATLSASGASVCIGARREALVQSIASSLSKKHKTNVVGVKVDVTNREQVNAFAETCKGARKPDFLINCAGVMHYTLMQDCEVDIWEKEVDVNIKGTLNCIGSVLKSMVARGSGHIVNISSDAGVKAFPGLSVYSATKFAIEGLSNAMRQELAETGVKVTVVQPGDVKTEISANQANNEARSLYAQGSKDRRYWLDPEDVANAVKFAVSAPNHCAVNALLIEPRSAPA